MHQAYELKTGEFEGPLDKLLGLIEERQLEITKINLAEVTADFISFIKTLEKTHPKFLADFIAVASKLILIKSHTLLPTLELSKEEEEDMKELEERLRLYKEFKLAEKNIKSMWAKKISYGREYLLTDAMAQNQFVLEEPVSIESLRAIMTRFAEELTILFPKIESRNIKLVSLEEKMKELVERVASAASTTFKDVSEGKNKMEIVVLFLAILHLLKDNLIRVDQAERFDDMQITKT